MNKLVPATIVLLLTVSLSISNEAICRAPEEHCDSFQQKCSEDPTDRVCLTMSRCPKTCGTYCEMYRGTLCKLAPPLPTSNGETQKCVNLHDWRQRALVRTNELRKRHGVRPLTHDPRLDSISQAYAELLIKENLWEHSSNGFGENLARAIGTMNNRPWRDFVQTQYRPEDPIDVWYAEINQWDFVSSIPMPGADKTGHLTQLIWNGSREAGHGFASDPSCSRIVSVAHYKPGGNLHGEYAANVYPLLPPEEAEKLEENNYRDHPRIAAGSMAAYGGTDEKRSFTNIQNVPEFIQQSKAYCEAPIPWCEGVAKRKRAPSTAVRRKRRNTNSSRASRSYRKLIYKYRHDNYLASRKADNKRFVTKGRYIRDTKSSNVCLKRWRTLDCGKVCDSDVELHKRYCSGKQSDRLGQFLAHILLSLVIALPII